MNGEPNPTAIECRSVSKAYGTQSALRSFDLKVGNGEILSLLGPSGSGKTTALRVIAGFEEPDGGEVMIGGRLVVGEGTSVPPEKRRVGMVFQDYALFPHMNVARNVGYGLGRSHGRGRLERLLDLVGLQDKADRMPHELSGGEQQRVALARALAPGPGVILLDEPFSNLDATLRIRMRREVRGILKSAGAAAIFVTHDQEEALAIADVVAVMRDGRVLQQAAPRDLYRRPVDRWVASFVGDSAFFEGTASSGKVDTALGTFSYTGSLRGRVDLMVRPEWIRLDDADGATAVVVGNEYYGHDQLVEVQLGVGRHISARVGAGPTYADGDRVVVSVAKFVVFAKDQERCSTSVRNSKP